MQKYLLFIGGFFIPMSKDIQQRLWGKVFPDAIRKRQEAAGRGWIPQAIASDETNIDINAILGEFTPKVLTIANPQSVSLIPEQLAIAGGWCALRTKDMESFKPDVGVLLNPQDGKPEPIKSVQQVCEWIVQSVAFDQVIESIGAATGAEYVAISERKLWSTRIVEKLTKIFLRDLTANEQQQIEEAVEISEQIKFSITQRYLEYVLGRKPQLARVVDEDIWEDLRGARDEMLQNAGLSIPLLQQEFPTDPTLVNTSLVWAMYTQPYFDVLRERGYIERNIAIVVEPSHHAFVETKAEVVMARRVFGERGRYFDANGFNNQTGFVTFIECLDGKGQNVRKTLAIDSVPNISNWKRLFTSSGFLSPENNATLTPSDNRLFLWGLNFIPFGKVQEALLQIISVQEEFKKKKDELANQFPVETRRDVNVRQSMQQKVEELRQELLQQVNQYNEVIAKELQQFFAFITKGIL